MENWLQYFLLSTSRACFFLVGAGLSVVVSAGGEHEGRLRANSELFDVGFTAGVINIENFPSEFVVGASITFKASEDFFLQYNYIQTEISKSSFENNPASNEFELGDDRAFKHYNLLLGYNLLPGEFFSGDEKNHLSSLYVVGGIGDTNFGGEENFTYTLGVGYQIEFFRKTILRFDYRAYLYQSSLVVADEQGVVNGQLSAGISYLF